MNCNSINLGLNSNSCNDGLRHIEQIALNKAGIDCLDGRVSRNEADIKDRYTKAELDRMLACKMDKCGYGRPHHHGNGKPNIYDYYTKEELDDLLAEIACKCDTYSKEELDDLLNKIACTCDCYSKDEVDSLLENKVNVAERYFPLAFTEKYTNPGDALNWYEVDRDNGLVTINLTATAKTDIKTGDHVLTMPMGFRGYMTQTATLLSATGRPLSHALLGIVSDGILSVHNLDLVEFPANCRLIICRMTYKAVV